MTARRRRPTVYPNRVRLYDASLQHPYWRVSWYAEDGQRKFRSFPNPQDAATWAEDKARQLRRGDGARGDEVFGRLLDQYIAERVATLDPTTYQAREGVVRNWLAELATVPCEQLTSALIERIAIAPVRGAGKSRDTEERVLRVVRAAVRYGWTTGHIPEGRDPSRGVRITPKVTDQNGPEVRADQVPSRDDAERLAQALASKHGEMPALMVRLAVTSGLRWGELVALTPRAITLDEAAPAIRVTRKVKELPHRRNTAERVIVEVPKGDKTRTTIYDPALVPALREHCRTLGADDLLFANTDGGFLHRSNFGRRMFRPAATAAGWPNRWSWHDLRHTWAHYCLTNLRLAPTDLRDLGGWATVDFVMRVYVGSTDETLGRAVAAFHRAAS